MVDKATADGLGITNSGTIGANGGSVILTARTASDLLKNVVNNSGIIEAKSLVQQEGQIILDGGDAGIVANSGTLDVSSAQSGAKGGSIGIFGKYIGLLDGAKVNASGDAGGGTILIGGNLHGDGPQPNASMTYVGSDAAISADAITSGNGGKVVVWSNDATSFTEISAQKAGHREETAGMSRCQGRIISISPAWSTRSRRWVIRALFCSTLPKSRLSMAPTEPIPGLRQAALLLSIQVRAPVRFSGRHHKYAIGHQRRYRHDLVA